ncbi:MAG: glycosyltransferase family 4 protein [Bacteroidota bacterium]|jgi:glycosyltransferase involved in cell wall biosynthesis
MHIGFLTPEYPGTKTGQSGGLGTSIYNLAHALVKSGHGVSVFVYGQSGDEYFEESGIRFYRIRNIRLKGLSWWLSRRKVENVIRAANLDILEVPDWTGFSAWMNINCPVVMRLNGSDTYFCTIENRPTKWWNRLQEKTAYRQADKIIAVSDYTGKKTIELFGVSHSYTVIPNSIDTSAFYTGRSISVDKPIILYFGTLIRKKGVLDIPAIFNRVVSQIPDAQLVLAGTDARDIQTGNPSTWALIKPLFTEEAFARVDYLGKKTYAEIHALIEQAQVCIFPSYAEALPVSWLEAMAMGKAIVASDIGWAKEMMTHEKEALLCYPAHHDVFAKQIIRLLNDSDLRNRLGTQARKRIGQQFDNLVVVNQNIELYRNAIHEYR